MFCFLVQIVDGQSTLANFVGEILLFQFEVNVFVGFFEVEVFRKKCDFVVSEDDILNVTPPIFLVACNLNDVTGMFLSTGLYLDLSCIWLFFVCGLVLDEVTRILLFLDGGDDVLSVWFLFALTGDVTRSLFFIRRNLAQHDKVGPRRFTKFKVKLLVASLHRSLGLHHQGPESLDGALMRDPGVDPFSVIFSESVDRCHILRTDVPFHAVTQMVKVNLVDETDVGDLFSLTLGQAFITDDCHDKRVNSIRVRRYGFGVEFFLLLILGTLEVELGSQQLDDQVLAHRHLLAVRDDVVVGDVSVVDVGVEEEDDVDDDGFNFLFLSRAKV